ncbi:saccharopine dehydrogenase-like oxidoreductase [Candidatus Desantisbacteria bacterium]|nr:saccharopine dehydrogenase-like oxidoreductase [Candidatus Desantisbacteria bacterium]
MAGIIRIAVLGAGGLGRSCAKILAKKKQMRLVAICDKEGYACSPDGLDADAISSVKIGGTIGDMDCGQRTKDSIGEIIGISKEIDGIFIALPNLPNDFMFNVVKRFIAAGYKGCFVDALKRTSAMEMMFRLYGELMQVNSTYITGCGATPGLLTAAAVIAAQSFVEVENVNIWWGVGISNWEEYKATIREDIAHLPGYTVDTALSMSDEEVEKFLDKTNGLLELHEMEHADDLLLEQIGVVDSRDKVTVGGIMDTRNAKKPVSTTMTLTGITFDGKRSSHRFILGDETNMAANVVGPALGYLKRAIWLNQHRIYGIYGSTEFMPCVVN